MTRPLALSTMYAQQERFADGAEFARFVESMGYDAIEVSHSTPVEKIEALARHGFPITSWHQPAPYARHSNGRGNSHVNLASTDEDERLAAVDYAARSIEWASRFGARKLVVHLGQVTDVSEQFEEELEMRRMFDRGEADSDRFPELREDASRRRGQGAEIHLEAARRSLLDLVRLAEPHHIAIGLENRYHYHEIPHPDEYEQLLDGLSPEQAGYWHDTGHAEVLHRLGFIDRNAWLERWSGRCIGAHLHDVLGIGDHRSPGDGDVRWDYIVRGVNHLPGFTLEINQHQSDERVRDAIAFLAGIGLR